MTRTIVVLPGRRLIEMDTVSDAKVEDGVLCMDQFMAAPGEWCFFLDTDEPMERLQRGLWPHTRRYATRKGRA